MFNTLLRLHLVYMMRKSFLFFIFLFFSEYLFASTSLVLPDGVDYEELNKDQKYKFQNVDYDELGRVNQYKGKLKFETPQEDFLWKEGRLYFGVGGQYSIIADAKMKSDKTQADANSIHAGAMFNEKSNWEMKNDFSYYASAGIYWVNGLKVEFEYSEANIATKNFGHNFSSPTFPSGTNIFNQYLQTSGVVTSTTTGGVTTTTLTNNMIPVVDFSVKTFMINVILEQSNIRSKLKPYIGFGAGMVRGSMDNLVNTDPSDVFGAQFLAGLSFPVVENIAVLYLGYRFVASMKMEQEFTRIIGASDFDGVTYTNPIFMQSKEKFKYTSNSVDLGLRFFF